MKLRKSYFGAFFLSALAMIVAGGIALYTVFRIPSSPFHQLLAFLTEFHFSPATFASQEYLTIAQHCMNWDIRISIPLMMIGGVVLGMRLRKRPRVREVIGCAIVSAVALSLIVTIMGWSLTIANERASMLEGGFTRLYGIDPTYLKELGLVTSTWIAAYVAGAFVGYMSLRRPWTAQRADAGGKPAVKRSAVGTAP